MIPLFSAFTRGSSPYLDKNERRTCACGAKRKDIENNIYQVTDKTDDPIYPKYYYKCRKCNSYSAVNIYLPLDKYDDHFQHMFIDDRKIELAARRTQWVAQAACGYISRNPLICDLGAGEGAFAHALADRFPRSQVYAVEADLRIEDKFYDRNDRVHFVSGFIEDFLKDKNTPQFDLITLTDMLEHVLYPEVLLDLISDKLKKGGVFYMTTPNSKTFENGGLPTRVKCDDVDWDDANRTCQHIFMMDEDFAAALVERNFTILEESSNFETEIRRDAVYTTIIAVK